jgi:hypothetical protein
VNIMPIKVYNSMGIIKRYHGLIYRVYSIITTEIPNIAKDIAL